MQGTVLIRSAEELENYSSGEEARIEEIIKSIAGGWLGSSSSGLCWVFLLCSGRSSRGVWGCVG